MKKDFIILTVVIVLLSSCSTAPTETYNSIGPTGALTSQQVTFHGNVCRYDTGLTIYTQGNCPPFVKTNVYTR